MIYYVSKGATLGQAGAVARNLWIGVTDIGTEDEFTYLSDESLVNWVCEGSAAGRAGKTKFPTHFFYKFARICEVIKMFLRIVSLFFYFALFCFLTNN